MRRIAVPAARAVNTQKGTGRAIVASPRNFSRWASMASCRKSWRGMVPPAIVKHGRFSFVFHGGNGRDLQPPTVGDNIITIEFFSEEAWKPRSLPAKPR